MLLNDLVSPHIPEEYINQKILIVDDDIYNILGFKAILESQLDMRFVDKICCHAGNG